MHKRKLATRTTLVAAAALAVVGTGLGSATGAAAPTAAGTAAARTAPAGRTASGGGGLKAPVVVDNFKPVLACNPNTTVGQEGCAEHKVLSADKQLSADIRLIFGLLGAQGKRDFINAQRSWAIYRHDDCLSQSDVYLGGTEQPVVYGTCLYADDLSRRQDLKGFYAVMVQDRASRPRFP